MMQTNVDLGKIDRLHLTRVAAQLGAKVPAGATMQRLVEEVSKIFAKLPKDELGVCDNCGGGSDSALQECPFCGLGEDDTSNDEPQMALMAPASVVAATLTGERKLDEALKEIEVLKAGATVNLWKLGLKIKEIYDATLWMQRVEDGKPAHKSFDAFVHHELKGMSKTTAYWLMDIAEAFSETEVLAYGRTKLGMILKAPKEDRGLLLDKVKAGINTRSLTEAVDAAREERGHYVRETSRGGADAIGRDQSPAHAAQAVAVKKGRKKKAKGDSITIAKTFGRQQVKLWAKPEKKGADPSKRARKIVDKPYGVLELENGVQMMFGLTTSSAGDWILVVETKRPES